VDRAVQAARSALASFSETTAQQRIDLLRSIIAVYERRQDEILAALTEEMGAPRMMARHTTAGLEAFQQTVEVLRDYKFEAMEGVNLIRRRGDRCGGADHALELAKPDDLQQAGVGARCGLPGCRQAF
jgi:aldehyde dehydrogenase (NAD+)